MVVFANVLNSPARVTGSLFTLLHLSANRKLPSHNGKVMQGSVRALFPATSPLMAFCSYRLRCGKTVWKEP